MYSEILKTNVRKILGQTILRKYGVKFSLTFGNNLKRKIFENLEEIRMYSKILKKFTMYKFLVNYSSAIGKKDPRSSWFSISKNRVSRVSANI